MSTFSIFSGKLDPHTSRQFPPTVLEWRANKKRVGMALDASCTDGYSRHAKVESFTTSEEFAASVLADRGLPELAGWTVTLEEGDTAAELNGGKSMGNVHQSRTSDELIALILNNNLEIWELLTFLFPV